MAIKIVVFIGMLLLVGLVFTSWQLTVEDYEQAYIVGNISQASNVSETFKSEVLSNQTNNINTSFQPILDSITSNENSEDGGFKVFAALFAVARSFIALPGVILDNLAVAVNQMSFVAIVLGVPEAILAVGFAGLLIFIIMTFVNAWRKHDA